MAHDSSSNEEEKEEIDSSSDGSLDRDADFSSLEASGLENAGVVNKGDEGSSNMKAELEDAKDKYLRTLAELENLRKRTMKERSELIRYQGDRILVDLLPVLDNLELALEHAAADPEKLAEGIKLIHKMFIDALGKWEVKAESQLGKPFDPSKAEAISNVPSPDAEPGTVISELKKTYFYKDKLLRVGEVVVADGGQKRED